MAVKLMASSVRRNIGAGMETIDRLGATTGET